MAMQGREPLSADRLPLIASRVRLGSGPLRFLRRHSAPIFVLALPCLLLAAGFPVSYRSVHLHLAVDSAGSIRQSVLRTLGPEQREEWQGILTSLENGDTVVLAGSSGETIRLIASLSDLDSVLVTSGVYYLRCWAGSLGPIWGQPVSPTRACCLDSLALRRSNPGLDTQPHWLTWRWWSVPVPRTIDSMLPGVALYKQGEFNGLSFEVGWQYRSAAVLNGRLLHLRDFNSLLREAGFSFDSSRLEEMVRLAGFFSALEEANPVTHPDPELPLPTAVLGFAPTLPLLSEMRVEPGEWTNNFGISYEGSWVTYPKGDTTAQVFAHHENRWGGERRVLDFLASGRRFVWLNPVAPPSR